MKPQGRLKKSTTMSFMMIAILLGGLLSLSGCITNKVLDLRKKHESQTKEVINFWSLSALRSAHVAASSDVFACVEFQDSPPDPPRAFTVNLSKIAQVGKTYADFMPASYGRTESLRESRGEADMTWYLYPLLEARKGCGKPADESPFPETELKVETVRMHREDQSRLPGILLSPEGALTNEARVIEVSFAAEGSGANAEPKAKNGLSNLRDVLLVYLPASQAGEQARAIGLSGAFEPGSEWVNPYSLLVVPAIAADTAIISMIIMLHGDPIGFYDRFASR